MGGMQIFWYLWTTERLVAALEGGTYQQGHPLLSR